MRLPALLVILQLFLASCQSLGARNDLPLGVDNSSPNLEQNSTTETHFAEDPGASRGEPPGVFSSTPQTISSSPVQIGPGNPEICNDPICMGNIFVMDPSNYPEEPLLILGHLSSEDPGMVFENVEVTFQFAGRSLTTQAVTTTVKTQVRGAGCFYAFLDPGAGEVVKIAADRTDDVFPAIMKEIQVPSKLGTSAATLCTPSDPAARPSLYF